MRARHRQLRAPRGVDGPAALHGRGVQQHEVIPIAGAVAGKGGHHPLDLVGQARAALPESVLGRQHRKQATELAPGRPQKPPIGADAQQRLGNAQRDDLRIGDPAPGVLGPPGQEIVRGAEDRGEQQVEVGEHRGPLGSTARISTADFDLRSITPATPTGVASLI
jgi:hypothetical protein